MAGVSPLAQRAMEKINLLKKFEWLSAHWQQRVVAELNSGESPAAQTAWA